MPIFTTPPQIPQRGARSTFSDAVDAFLQWMGALPAMLDTFLAQLSTLAAGGANSLPYIFDSSIADSDPGAGKVRLSNTSQGSATVLRIDPVTAAGVNVSALLLSLLAGTSSNKASLRLQKRGDPTRWLLFDVSTGSGSGYFNLTVTPRASSAPAPFANGDDLMLFFDKIGDKGDVGNADKTVQTAPAPVGGVVTVDYRAGNCLVWTPPASAASQLKIVNWPAAGTLGEFQIEGINLGAATLTLSQAVNWVRPDGTFTFTASINTNQGATLRPTGEDTVLLWGRAGAPDKGKVVR
jgi:hypothetical protein